MKKNNHWSTKKFFFELPKKFDRFWGIFGAPKPKMSLFLPDWLQFLRYSNDPLIRFFNLYNNNNVNFMIMFAPAKNK